MSTTPYIKKRDFSICDTVSVCATTNRECVEQIFDLPVEPVSATIDLVGVPAVISASESEEIKEMYSKATMAIIDGMPIVKRALKCDKVGKALKKDILSYRAVAYLKVKDYEAALEDCQTLAENYKMDADLYFLTGETALAMDSYEEASANFEQAYGEDATYDRAIQIYGAYLNRDMEADGTRYLEAALSGTAKNAEDHCDRGRVYYYMDDYENAESELKQAIDGDNTEALVLLGMVYMDKGDSANAKAMFQQYVSQAENGAKGFNGLALCDIEDGDYDSALSDIESGIHVAGAEDMQSLLFNEIVVYEKKLDFQTALQKAQEYLELYPEDKTVKKELAFLKTRV